MTYRYSHTRHSGFTLTEMLVVMVIVGLLATIAIPVYINRMEESRVKLAQGECKQIADAEDQCALIHGFYVPFQILNALPHPQNQTRNGDTIRNQPNPSSIYLINPLIRPNYQIGSQWTLNDGINGNNARVTLMVNYWEGPFLNLHRVYVQQGFNPVNNYNYYDFPLDPWGNPYLFYSALGIIGQYISSGNFTNLTINFSNGQLTNLDQRNYIDRYAVVSYGHDGLPNTITPNYFDDVIYLFGTPGVESGFGL
ncbi:MAG: prepilin-type N-terminal cleavage/methylation domain-containing protein [bacterium]|nr:prepilin-type N-terminal cleavage/methylation domain-containing protein [Candidatus Sumerlaeota bacterium]